MADRGLTDRRAAALGLAGALVLDALRPRGRAWAYATVAGLVGMAVLQVPFLVV